MPRRGLSEVLASEPCNRKTSCRETWPGASSRSTAWASSIFVRLQFLVEGHVGRLDRPMPAQFPVLVRALDDPETTVLRGCGIDRDPDRAGRERPDRPVFAVLMPGRALAVARGLGKEARVPEREVGPEHLLDHVEDRGLAGKIQKAGVVPQQARAVVAELGMPGQQPVVRGPDRGDRRLWQPEIGNDVAGLMVLVDLGLTEHAAVPLRRVGDAEPSAAPPAPEGLSFGRLLCLPLRL